MVSPPRLTHTLTFEWRALVAETWDGLRLSSSQYALNRPLVGEGEEDEV